MRKDAKGNLEFLFDYMGDKIHVRIKTEDLMVQMAHKARLNSTGKASAVYGYITAEVITPKPEPKSDEVARAEELVAQHKFAVQQGDNVHTQNVEADVVDYGNKLMRQVGGMAEFAAAAKAEHSAFRREMQRQVNPQAKALTVLFNYVHEYAQEEPCSFVHQRVEPKMRPSYVDWKVGMRVRVCHKNYGEATSFEGMATIKKIHQGDKGGIHADVEFDGKPGDIVQRWIFAHDQDPELEYVV